MKAVAVDQFGGVPTLRDLPVPVPQEGELLVRVAAAGMNPLDWKLLDGRAKGRPTLFPLVLGTDGAGRVERPGPGTHRFAAGDSIFGQFLHTPVGTGTYAEFTLVPESLGVSRIPSGLSAVEAAALPTAGMTALVALDRLGLKKGTSLLIVGASGGVGSFAVQLAKRRGLKVIGAARPTAFDRLRRLGAAETVDLTDPDWLRTLARRYPRGVGGALDLMSDRPGFLGVLGRVRKGGRGASTVGAAVPEGRTDRDVESLSADLEPTTALLDRLADEVVHGTLLVPVERTISLAEAPAALEELRAGRGVGKTVVRIADA